jgi:hypothetical protein
MARPTRFERVASTFHAMTKLPKRVVDAAEAQEKDYVIWDDDLPGFGLRVFVSGKRSYIASLLDGKEFKQTAYALDRDSRKAAFARFLRKAAGDKAEREDEQRLAA